MEQVLATCKERGIKVVTNAGGLNPAGCAEKVRDIAAALGLDVKVAHVEGDDLLPRIDGLRPQLTHLDTGAPLTGAPITANAYLGGWGIAAALAAGADVVVCPRVTDAALVVGPAAWWHDWARRRLGPAGRCGGGRSRHRVRNTGHRRQLHVVRRDPRPATAARVPDRRGRGRRLVRDHQAPRHRWRRRTSGPSPPSCCTRSARPAYANPDVVTHFESIQVTQEGVDRVLLSGVQRLPRAGHGEGLPQPGGRLPQPDVVRAHRAAPGRRRRTWVRARVVHPTRRQGPVRRGRRAFRARAERRARHRRSRPAACTSP